MASFCSSNDKRNFQWVTVASVDLIKLPLIDILTSHIKPADLFQKIQSCLSLKLLPDQRKFCLIQPPGLPDYNTFDVTLLYTLIRNLCGLPSPAQGWGKEPKATDTEISDDIERLRLFRNNYYGHAISASISDAIFGDVWRNLKLAIKRFNSKIRCNIDYEEELIKIERSKFTEYQLETCRVLLDALANIQKQTDSKDEPDISITGENEKKCGETALFEADVKKVKSSSWTITWQKRKGNVIECIDTSTEKYSGSTKRRLVIKSVCKEDKGEYQAVLSFELNGPYYTSKNTICLYILGDLPSVRIFVDSPVCFGYRSTIKSEISSTTRLEKIEWQKSKDGIDFHRTENPIYSISPAIFTNPSYVIPKTTFNDKLYYRLLVWNENGEGVSNTVFLNVTGRESTEEEKKAIVTVMPSDSELIGHRGNNMKQRPTTGKETLEPEKEKREIKDKANSVSTRLANTRSFSKGTHNQTCVLSSYIKAEVSRSVGLIYIDNEPAGTGFRVGEMYIAACAHIIVEVGSAGPHFIACDRMAIEFDRKKFNQRVDTFQVFHFRNISYLDEEHDFVVLELSCHQAGVGFPPPLTCFGEVALSEIYLVGHPNGREMKEDDIFPYWSTEHENKIKELGKWSSGYFPDKMDYYSILLEPPRKILFDTTFNHGASGSPGVTIRDDKPCVVLIFAGGTPKFIYDNPDSTLQVQDHQKVEYGFPISDIYIKMWNSPQQNVKDLASNIFTKFL